MYIEHISSTIHDDRERLRREYELENAKHLESHYVAEQKAREKHQNKLIAMRAAIDSEELTEVAKKDKLLEVEHKAKEDLDAELRRMQSNLLKEINEREKEATSRVNAMEAKYRVLMAELTSEIEDLREDRVDLEAHLVASAKRFEIQAAQSETNVAALRVEIGQLKTRLLGMEKEAKLVHQVRLPNNLVVNKLTSKENWLPKNINADGRCCNMSD
ncbi:hypothetical protein AAMO2058_000917200 [Amorphochlora amoebiformis]